MSHKCLAAFIVFCLYFTISLALILGEFQMFLRPGPIREIVDQSQLFENLPKMFDISKMTNQNGTEGNLLFSAIAKSVSPTNLEKEFQKNLNPFFAYLNGQGSLANITFDLTDIKKELEKNLNSNLADEVKNLAPCPEGENSPENKAIPSCLPQGVTAEQLGTQINNSNVSAQIVPTIPDTLNPANLKGAQKIFERIKLGYRLVKIGFYISLGLSIFFILLLILLGRRWWPSIPRWVGLSLVLPSGSILLMNLLSQSLTSVISGKYSQGLDPQVSKLINPLIDAVNTQTISRSYLVAGLVFGLGAIGIILSYALPHPPEPKLQSPKTSSPPPPAPPAVGLHEAK